MASYYTIVQYSPSPISDERISFGVLVFGDGAVRSHFVRNMERVRRFGAEMGVVRGFIQDADDLTEEAVRQMIENWTYSIRLTEPRGSLLEPDALLLDVVDEFLIDPPEHKPKYRYRRDAADLARRSLAKALRESVHGDAKTYLRTDLKIEAKKGTHYFDVGLQNERPRVGARGLSFELPEGPELAKEVNSTTFTVQDVSKTLPGMQVSIIVLPPPKPTDMYKRAVDTLQEAGAEVVNEDGVKKWAKRSVDSFISHHAPNRPNVTTLPRRHR